uniref:Uncharacterized protein n=1 Tax=Arundo donax TaxID=35708 RepID=A0A0A8ZVH4_ARUDO
MVPIRYDRIVNSVVAS